MIDCSVTVNYLKEKVRMTEKCKIYCDNCPLSFHNNSEKVGCVILETEYPDKSVEIVQKWSNEHPQKTLIEDLKEKYPNYNHYEDDTTPTFCPYALGYEEYETVNKNCFANTCAECWNRPLDEVIK